LDTSPLDGRRCLVTGGAGYLGRNLVTALLAKGCPVNVLDTAPAPCSRDGVRWFQGDVRSLSDVLAASNDVDTVFHTAAVIEALTHARRSVVRTVEAINVGGTRNVIRAARQSGVRRLVHTSSIVVTFCMDAAGRDESAPYSTARDLYTRTKIAGERAVLDANGSDGLLTCGIRPGGIYGPGERLTYGRLVRALRMGVPLVVFGDGGARLDYVYIDSLVDAEMRAAERLFEGSPVCGEAYFMSDETPTNAGQFSIELVKNMGLQTRLVRVPDGVARAMGVAMERIYQALGGPKPLFTEANVKLCDIDHYFSIDKAKQDLGYRPLVDTKEGLRRTAEEARAYYESL
ncbi:MAG: NAD-dependent epimerase/dehydratase family protein, partial [Deltaproteobacteria bacterium]|nr:NAD-dependent epimerase/dehydratase family protein [Deltaproteobacteria bacterium]